MSSSSFSSNNAHDDDIPRSRIDEDASGAPRDFDVEEMEEDDDDAIAVGANCDDRDGNCEDERRRDRNRFVEEVVDAPSVVSSLSHSSVSSRADAAARAKDHGCPDGNDDDCLAISPSWGCPDWQATTCVG